MSVQCGKTPEQIWMRFGVVGQTGPRMRQVVGFGDRSTGRANFGGEFGVCHCNQWGLCGATQPYSQITLGRLIIIIKIICRVQGLLKDHLCATATSCYSNGKV